MKILMAIDIREETSWMLNDVADWAARLGARVDLVYVDAFGNTGAYVLDAKIYALLKAELAAERRAVINRLQEIGDQMPAEVRGEVHALSGHPVDRVLEMAPNYDVIVVGTHGRTGIRHAMLGSVAERIVRRSPITTIVLRPSVPAEDG